MLPLAKPVGATCKVTAVCECGKVFHSVGRGELDAVDDANAQRAECRAMSPSVHAELRKHAAERGRS